MSTFRVVMVERLGPPDPSWPTVYGPTAGADPIAANGLRTLDLTPHLSPLQDFSVTLERDLTKSSFGSLNLDLDDPDGSLAATLGPGTTTLGITSRYYGPWVQLWEDWSGGSELRFFGYLDETSLEWSEEDAQTRATALHATQLLRERLLTDFPDLLRAYPRVPTTASESFAQSNADDLLAAISAYTPRSNKLALESALWATGQLSWLAQRSSSYGCTGIMHPDGTVDHYTCRTSTYAAPTAPALSLTIAGHTYLVDRIEQDTTLSEEDSYGTEGVTPKYGTDDYAVYRIVLQGAPDLTGILTAGATVSWGVSEENRTHYVLADNVPAPASGSDGQRFLRLNTVEQLVAGDVLTVTYTDSTSGAPRLTTMDLPPIVDLDGETGRVWLAGPITQALTTSTVKKIRRNSQDPALFDGLAYAEAVCAPFSLSTDYFQQASTAAPIPAWLPYDAASPQLYGVHNLQVVKTDGTLQLARRGADNGSGAYTVPGVWRGSWSAGWTWLGMPAASSTHEIYGDPFQFPGGSNPYDPPVIYLEGDLSAGATIPVNGWRPRWRTLATPTAQSQAIDSYWNGTAVQWASQAASGDVPAKVVSFAATTTAPGRYTRTSGGTWTFDPHTGHATLGASTTPTITGTTPTGSWIALGMGIYADPTAGHQEAQLALVATGTAFPWTGMTACLMSCGAAGALTVKQSVALSLPPANGPWALGGGLAVVTWNETRGTNTYPRTRLHLVDGRTTPLTADFPTLEILPGTIQPLQKNGTGAGSVVYGWYALALETYEDANYHLSRRLRFLWLNKDLTLINGEAESDPADPTNPSASFSRGEVLAESVADGAILARLVRTAAASDAMVGIAGGRLFGVDKKLPATVERLKIGATALSSSSIGSVVGSGDGLSVMDYLDLFAGSQVATALPSASGGMRLVSRAGGELRLRTGVVAGKVVSVQEGERAKKRQTLAWQGFIRTVRVSYGDALTGQNLTVEVGSAYDGGKILDLDVSQIVWGMAAARAIGKAAINLYGNPQGILSETWVDGTFGAADGLAPAFHASWEVGDVATFDLVDIAAGPWSVQGYKILSKKPGLEAGSVDVELLALKDPQLVGSVGWVEPGWVQPGWVSGGAS